jgi:oxygen-independent coproporphyrinogen-3 oxidase
LIAALPSLVDSGLVREQFARAADRFRIEDSALPSPVWAERGYDDSGRQAWEVLRRESPARKSGLAVYVHIPFCDRKCAFCDCYSIPVRNGGERLRRPYVKALLRELDLWATIPAVEGRSVSTVHFGGGTPLFLDPEDFAALVARLRSRLAIGPDTELAIETTTSALNLESLDRLRALGFSRLHVGVQTLDDAARTALGRKEAAAVVLAKLGQALQGGFTTTVDVLYGLPRQSAGELLETLQALVDVGIDGLSLYRLNRTRNNERRLKRIHGWPRDSRLEYLLFLLGHEYLIGRGFQKNHFTHFASHRDRNLYYTHLVRGEDLLAVGATADGVIGTYHYRHPPLPAYAGGLPDNGIALEGGVRESERERRLAVVIATTMAAVPRRSAFEEAGLGDLFTAWERDSLVQGIPGGQGHRLTANGSWFINQMIEAAKNAVAVSAP